MTEAAPKRRILPLPLLLGLTLLVVLAFLGLLLWMQGSAPDAGTNPPEFAAELAAAMQGADARRGAELSAAYECALCHLQGDGSAAPLFPGLGDLAAQRRPPLNAEQYLYEAIVYPSAYLLPGYSDAMPSNYGERLTTAEIADLIAYMLTFRAQESGS